jgi:hypothetical protein
MRARATVLLAAALLFAGCAGSGGGGDDDGAGGGAGGFGGGAGGAGGFGGGAGGFGGGGGGFGGDNARPELMRIGDREAPVGQTLEIALSASDADGDPLTYSVRSTLPQGAKFDKAQGRFTWTPEEEGTIVLITFEVSDGQLKDQETIQITVVSADQAGNKPPELDDPGDLVLAAGRPFTLQLEATDPNGDPLEFSLRGDTLEGATLDAAKGEFRWTPPAEANGRSFDVQFVVSDGQAETTADVRLVVGDGGNLPPRIAQIDDVEARAGQQVRIQVVAEDDRPESLVYGIVGTPPDGATIDTGSGLFTWTPRAEHAGQAFRVVFEASDGEFRAVRRTTIQVVAGGETPVDCPADAGEPGPEALQSGQALEGRSVCPVGDEDTYNFDVPAGGSFRVDVRFQHAQGDLDLAVTGPGGFAQTSDSVTDLETVLGQNVAGGRYQARVYGFDSANPSYSIRFDAMAGMPQECADDAADAVGNDAAGRAVNLRDYDGVNLKICPNDDDFYSVDLTAGTRVALRVLFSHAEGDLDIELTGPDGFRAQGTSSNDDEEIAIAAVPVTGTYILRVYGYQGAENEYLIELEEEAAAPCTPDRVEPNDTRQNAEPFRPELYRGLTWCGDADWYKTDVPANNELVVFVSYTGNRAPVVEATDANGARIPGQSFEVAQGDGCQAGRAGCRRLVARPAAPGFVFWSVTQGTVGMEYDTSVRVLPRAGGGGACSAANQTCGEVYICDYDVQQCVLSDCSADPDACPGDYLCHQTWCVELCDDDLGCARADHTCKRLGDIEMCGLEGVSGVGESCLDFTECAGSYDCLDRVGVPGGYCTRECARDADCDAGGVCVGFGGGNYCGDECANDGECRAGYGCRRQNRVGGGTANICTPL